MWRSETHLRSQGDVPHSLHLLMLLLLPATMCLLLLPLPCPSQLLPNSLCPCLCLCHQQLLTPAERLLLPTA